MFSEIRVAGRRRPRHRICSATAERLLGEMRAEAARADVKASVLIAAMGVGTGVLAGVRVHAAPSLLSDVCWIVGGGLSATGFAMLLIAIAPRSGGSRSGPALTHFGDVYAAAEAARLEEALQWTEQHPDLSVLSAMAVLSRIVVVKYRWIRAALGSFAIGLPTLALAVIGG